MAINAAGAIDLLALERELAGVMTLGDMTGVVKQLKEIAGASAAMVFAFDDSGFPTARGGDLVDVMRAYTPDLFHEDVLLGHSLASPKDRFLCSAEDHADLRDHLRSRPYADFYRPHDIGHVYAVWPSGLPYGSEGLFGLFLCTSRPSQRLEDDALARLRALEAPMRAAARRIARFSRLQQERDVLGQLVGHARGAFVVWDHDGRQVWASPEAAALLNGRRTLRELERVAGAAREQLLGRARPHPSLFDGAVRIDGGRGGVPLLVALSAIRSVDRLPWLLAELRAYDGVHARLAALSGAERRVLALLARGHSNREIAGALCVSGETVKTHVSHILEKLQVSNRVQAANLATEARAGRAP